MKTSLALALVLCIWVGCNRTSTTNPVTFIEDGFDSDAMEEAITRARSEVRQFLAELESPTGHDHAVKVAVGEDGQGEHIWVADVRFENGKFHGVIGNEPAIVTSVAIGQPWTVDLAEITDWMFMRNGKVHGNYTLRPLLETMPKQQAEELRAMLAEP